MDRAQVVKLLLDTHIWIWSLLEPERLGRRVARELLSDDSELWLSPVSVWELLILVEKKRVLLPSAPHRWIEDALRAAPIREAPLNHAVALMSRTIQLPQQDPADRFIAATAAIYDLTLVTADDAMLRGKGFRHLSNHR
jgi:PIN domain nuclease of toxin-antitoxin system